MPHCVYILSYDIEKNNRLSQKINNSPVRFRERLLKSCQDVYGVGFRRGSGKNTGTGAYKASPEFNRRVKAE